MTGLKLVLEHLISYVLKENRKIRKHIAPHKLRLARLRERVCDLWQILLKGAHLLNVSAVWGRKWNLFVGVDDRVCHFQLVCLGDRPHFSHRCARFGKWQEKFQVLVLMFFTQFAPKPGINCLVHGAISIWLYGFICLIYCTSGTFSLLKPHAFWQ